MFDDAVKQSLTIIARKLGVELAALMAVVEIESGGKAFATVGGRDMPLIRWEGHYFWRLLPVDLRKSAAQKGLASPNWGVVKNPAGQEARYNLLARAKAIHEEAAIGSCSWGVGQVMGSHWQWLGYASARELEATAISGIDGQMDLMARFMEKAKCLDELVNRDFYGFARIYNGPGQVQVYGKLISNAYKRHSGHAAPAASGALKVGSRGPEVSRLQENLRKLGYHLTVDGDFGPATRAAVMAFQRDHGLSVDGIAGAGTWSVIERLQGTPHGVGHNDG